MNLPETIKLAAVCGSVRPKNYTGQVLNFAIDRLQKNSQVQVSVIDPAEKILLFPGHQGHSSADEIQRVVQESSGVILATPEYHGTFSSVMKLILENLGDPSALQGKPVLLIGVTSGNLGAVTAIEHLASVCLHLGAIVFSKFIYISRVGEFFIEGQCRDAKMEKRIHATFQQFINFIQTIKERT